MLKRFCALITAILMVSLIGTAHASNKEPLRIAFIDPLSGPMAVVGVSALRNMQLHAEIINEKGGINGHKVEIVTFDNELSPQKTQQHFQKAVNDGIRYFVLMGGDAFAATLISAVDRHNERNPKNPVMYLNYGANGAQFTNERCSFWHFLFDSNTDMKMNIMTDWIASQENIKKVFLINQDYSFGHDVSRNATELLAKKRPDIEIVGDILHPLAQVKDFTPYVARIKAAGADAVITGNWGSDVTLLVKAAASSGLKIPFVTLYAGTPGAPSAIGKQGVGTVYMTWLYHGDFDNPEMARRQEVLKGKTGYDYWDLRNSYMMDMLKAAAEKAGSIEPTEVAFALEGLEIEGPAGGVFMRAEDHQIQVPMFVSVFQDGMKYSLEDTDGLNFHAISKYTAEQGELPTSCKMVRPKR